MPDGSHHSALKQPGGEPGDSATQDVTFHDLCAMAVTLGLDRAGDDGCGFITLAYKAGAANLTRRYLYGQDAIGIVTALCRDLQQPPGAFEFIPHADEPASMAWAQVAGQRMARISGLDIAARGGLTTGWLKIAAAILDGDGFNPFHQRSSSEADRPSGSATNMEHPYS